MGENALTEKIRSKYPGQYDDLDADTLTKKIVAKYPQYADLAGKPASNAPSLSPREQMQKKLQALTAANAKPLPAQFDPSSTINQIRNSDIVAAPRDAAIGAAKSFVGQDVSAGSILAAPFKGAWGMANLAHEASPGTMLENAIAGKPILGERALALAKAHQEQINKGNYAAAVVPLFGPAAAGYGEQIAQGRELANKGDVVGAKQQVMEGVGGGGGIIGQILALRGAPEAVPDSILSKTLADTGKVFNKRVDTVSAALKSSLPDVPKSDAVAGSMQAIDDFMAQRGISPKDVSGRQGPQKFYQIVDEAGKDVNAKFQSIQEPVAGRAISDAARKKIMDAAVSTLGKTTDILAPQLRPQFEALQARLGKLETIADVAEAKTFANQLADAYYNMMESGQPDAAAGLKNMNNIANALRDVQYGEVARYTGADEMVLRQMNRTEKSLIDLKRMTDKTRKAVMDAESIHQGTNLTEKVRNQGISFYKDVKKITGIEQSPIEQFNTKIQRALGGQKTVPPMQASSPFVNTAQPQGKMGLLPETATQNPTIIGPKVAQRNAPRPLPNSPTDMNPGELIASILQGSKDLAAKRALPPSPFAETPGASNTFQVGPHAPNMSRGEMIAALMRYLGRDYTKSLPERGFIPESGPISTGKPRIGSGPGEANFTKPLTADEIIRPRKKKK